MSNKMNATGYGIITPLPMPEMVCQLNDIKFILLRWMETCCILLSPLYTLMT